MEKKEIEFIGIASQYKSEESFAWDVSKEDFIKITGREPNQNDKGIYIKDTYRVFPEMLYKEDSKYKIKIYIEKL
ncbi:hypothetical protein [Clostridium saccharoperbutylacetonicum]|uniref:hypothetical protein n=1 Tax=Clostridium saccharoperbutylacetonicum TaxID=36745 RepID=UPI0039EC97E9